MDFTPKRRLLAAIKGQEVDHVPFAPILAYYFDFLPEDIRQKGDLAYLIEMGADPLLRGSPQAYSIGGREITRSENITGNQKVVARSFRGGALTSVYTYSQTAKSWFLTKHPVETPDDLKLFIEFLRKTEILPEIDKANESVRKLGEQGLHLAILGMDLKSSFQGLLENWIGTENLVYFCMDHPDLINEALRLMRELNLKTVGFTAESEAAACLSFEDSSTTNVSPAMYREYIMPEISEWCKILDQAGKPFVQHACGHVKKLLPMFAEQKITAVESISPPPTGNVTIAEAAEVLPKDISIIGGIEPVQFLNDPIDKLLKYIEDLLIINNGRGFVLSNSDSCPPFVEYDKFRAIAQFVKSH